MKKWIEPQVFDLALKETKKHPGAPGVGQLVCPGCNKPIVSGNHKKDCPYNNPS